eukprot:5400182-Amphidinium_carterae.2
MDSAERHLWPELLEGHRGSHRESSECTFVLKQSPMCTGPALPNHLDKLRSMERPSTAGRTGRSELAYSSGELWNVKVTTGVEVSAAC